MNLLKQGQYAPVPVEKQVVSIYAATNGFLEDIEVKDIKRFEKELLEYIDVNNKSLFDEIRISKTLNDDTVEKIKKLLNEFHSKFKKSE